MVEFSLSIGIAGIEVVVAGILKLGMQSAEGELVKLPESLLMAEMVVRLMAGFLALLLRLLCGR
jgi:hypothetical protein